MIVDADNPHLGLIGKRLDLRDESRERNYDLSLRSRGLLGDLGGGVERVRGGANRSEPRSRQEPEKELRAVVEKEHDDVTLPDSHAGEPGGDAEGRELHVSVGEGVAGGPVDEARLVAELGDVLEAVRVEWKVVWDVNVR